MIEKDFRFEAAHVLPYHDGKCRWLHGHSWLVTVRLDGDDISHTPHQPTHGMLADFASVKTIVAPLITRMDHRNLNEVLSMDSPTCEAIAAYIFNELSCVAWPFHGVRLHSVTVHETCTSRATVGERLW
jgi:6-pyruvoyltetrahydropterin/6-carboxytetrahydropterin synthase